MKVSVVTISYNQGDYLRSCIESVLHQDYKDIEYIVVDPGSTDASRGIIEQYRNEIQQIIYDKDQGPSDGLNNGFACATGDIYYYLNADDFLLQGSLKRAVDTFDRLRNCDIILARAYQVDSAGAVLRTLSPSRIWTPYRYAGGIAKAVQQGTFFRASAFKATLGFNVNNHTCWDGELLVDMVLNGAQVCTVKDILACFRIYAGSISGSGRLENSYYQDQARIRQRILASIPEDDKKVPLWMLRCSDLITEPSRVFRGGKHRIHRRLAAIRKRR